MPRCSVLASPLITPASNSSTTPSENISVCTPRSRRSLSSERIASGTSPIPICSVEPFSTSSAARRPIARDTAPSSAGRGSSTTGRSTSTAWLKRETWMKQSPSVRGMRDVDERDHVARRLRRGLRAVHSHAERAEAVLVGRRDVDERHVDRLAARRDQARDVGEVDGHEVGAALVDGLPDVRAGEERAVPEARPRSADRRTAPRRASSGGRAPRPAARPRGPRARARAAPGCSSRDAPRRGRPSARRPRPPARSRASSGTARPSATRPAGRPGSGTP